MDHLFLVVPSQAYIVKFIETFKEFPPRQKPASFGIDQALETLQHSRRTLAGTRHHCLLLVPDRPRAIGDGTG